MASHIGFGGSEQGSLDLRSDRCGIDISIYCSALGLFGVRDADSTQLLAVRSFNSQPLPSCQLTAQAALRAIRPSRPRAVSRTLLARIVSSVPSDLYGAYLATTTIRAHVISIAGQRLNWAPAAERVPHSRLRARCAL